MNLYNILGKILNFFLSLNLHYSIVLSRLPYGATFLQSSDGKLFTQKPCSAHYFSLNADSDAE